MTFVATSKVLTTFFLLYASLKENRYLKEIRKVMIEETLAIFHIIVCHNVRMRVITYHSRYFFKIVDRHFILTLRACLVH